MTLRRNLTGLGVAAVGAWLITGIAGGGAAAATITPLPGGVQVQLNHAETLWARDNGVGDAVARLPHPSAASFGGAFDNATTLAGQYPNGYVVFSAFGPVERLGGYMYAMKE